MSEKNYNLAFVFPGQGSQSIGMLAELAERFSLIKETFERASDTLALDLWQLIQNGPIEDLNQTQNTQPAMLAAGYAIWKVWQTQSDVKPGWVAGHSLGEYTALVSANSISFEDAVKLVAERGRLMQESMPDGAGAMAAIIGLENHKVVQACVDAAQGQVASAVNFNAPGQVVIAGNTEAIERAIDLSKELGAKRALKLPVSVPSHCELMKPAADKLAEKLKTIEFEIPDLTLIHNVDVASHSSSDVLKNALKEQLYKPVRWIETVKYMNEQGVECFIECGPGKVLMGLNKRIVKSAQHLTIFDSQTLDQALEYMNG